MKRDQILIIISVLLLMPLSVVAQKWGPDIGYVYPAGAQKGTTITVGVAGQYLRAMKDVHISGEGVEVSIVTNMPAFPNNLNRERRYLVMDLAVKTMMTRFKESGMSDEEVNDLRASLIKKWPWNALKSTKNLELEGERIPPHFLIQNFENKSIREVIHAQHILFFPNKYKQINRQLAEMVLLKVEVDKDAKVGERKLWLSSPKKGTSKPVIFQIGDVNETRELEPNDAKAFEYPWYMNDCKEHFVGKPEAVPFVMNGQIMPGDADRFRFKAKKGQKLLIEVDARRLIPYLADAVPGWFQAVITLYDSKGKELAFVDDHYINPDPVMYYEVTEDGEYDLEIRDAIYRGREDFVYRISVQDAPWAKKELTKGSKYGDKWTRRAVFPLGVTEKDVIPADVRSLPKGRETADNNSVKNAQKVEMPVLLNGSISDTEDVDVYKVSMAEPGELAVEVYGRRLGSPLDSVIKITDKNGKVIAVNDDYVLKHKHLHIDPQGIITHHADSRLVAELPGKGDYYVHIMDSQNAGGPQYGYRLRISEPMSGFSVIASPGFVMARKNEHVPVILYADRRDGYNGEIDFELGEDSDFAVTGGNIPSGELSSLITVQTKKKGTGEKQPLELKAVAVVGKEKVSFDVKAADRVMQAFLYEHLMPAGKLSVVVRKEKWGSPFVDPVDCSILELKPGESKRMKLKVSWVGKDDKHEVALDHAPEGISVDQSVTLTPNKVFEFTLNVDKDCKPLAANITASVWTLRDRVNKEGKKRTDKWRSHRTPAISLIVTGKDSNAVVSTK
ncbi:hypothetical protein BVX94_00260 [bacterium B17]|nr:hypothetical protein BVX94_00260 [bacterium B17]